MSACRSARIVSQVAAVAAAIASASCAAAGKSDVPAGPHQVANADFFAWGAALWIVLPIVIAGAWAAWRAKTRPSELPVFDDENFEPDVLGSQMPVLVHFSRAWNVPNRAALSQTEILAWRNRGAVHVGLIDIDANPKTMARFPNIEPPAYLLFYRGRKLFHRPGLIQADDLQTEIDIALSRENF